MLEKLRPFLIDDDSKLRFQAFSTNPVGRRNLDCCVELGVEVTECTTNGLANVLRFHRELTNTAEKHLTTQVCKKENPFHRSKLYFEGRGGS